MQSEGISPDAVTYACILKACGTVQDAGMGKKIHDDIVSQGLLQKSVVLGIALIDMYAKCGVLQKAQKLLEELPVRNATTYTCILKACGTTQDTDLGKRIHDDIVSKGLLKKDVLLGTALVDMYAKCGVLQKAQKVLEELPIRNVDSYNALIAGYAEQGQGQEALGCFQRMQTECISPDSVTYTFILKAMLPS
ncbi:hypothetical protein L7F22_064011 [Adiantum nelumboides]|nr:hypothetical protein [Adiantum nelumboides]